MTNGEVLIAAGLLVVLGFFGLWAVQEFTHLRQKVNDLEAKMQPGYQIPDCVDWVGPGWVHLLEDLHLQISVIDPNYRITTLKEKFGMLSIVGIICEPGLHLAIRQTVTAAENKSCSICEFCGEPGEPRFPNGNTRGWVKTVCDRHAELRSRTE